MHNRGRPQKGTCTISLNLEFTVTEHERNTISQIEQAICGSGPIPSSKVRGWMSNHSLEVQGALTHLLAKESRRIRPSLTWAEVCSVFGNYYKECLIQNVRQSDYVPSRHVAGFELANWFKYIWGEPSVPRQQILDLKEMLRELYLSNKSIRNAIVTAVLEHLFEVQEIAEYFGDWKADPVLSKAYAGAEEWGKAHGSKSG